MSMNVKMTMVAVVIFAPTLKEALNVRVERDMYCTIMERTVQQVRE